MPSIIYEINTRVWIKQFAKVDKKPTLLDVPDKYWKSLVNKGIEYVWLMGIWEIVPESVDEFCFTDALKSEYSAALPDWKKEDVIGSPYAINDYKPNKELSTFDELVILKKSLNSIGIKIILDFIPNHFNAHTSLLKTNPEIFLKGNEELLSADSNTFFKAKDGNIYAHGKDPNFSAWEDTIQINYFSEIARQFMLKQLLKICEFCNGVRCDMAMLPLYNEFKSTWHNTLNSTGINDIKEEFWDHAINTVKEKNPDFIFIAEAYWNLEWHLQQLGFDFTYDKRLLERMEYGDAENILMHLNADEEFQKKSLRFIENHDEQRAITSLGIDRSIAASVIISTINGLTFFNDGQFEGKSIRIPVQLGREPMEEKNEIIYRFYENLFSIIKDPIFKKGSWSKLEPIPLENNFTFNNILAWQWNYNDNLRIVITNYSQNSAYCRIKFKINSSQKKIFLHDLLNNNKYERDVKEILDDGLFIHLEPYKSHIFTIEYHSI